MSLTYGFYNSVDHDRVYDATQFGSIFDGVINDGVFQNIGDLFVVSPHEGMKVFVGTGRAWFNGTWTLNDSNIELTVTESHPIYTRIDAIVLEVNANSDVRENTIKIVEGTPASSAERPTLIDDEFQHQHPLAYITVQPNASAITDVDIENVVGLEEEGCPFVTGILEVNSVDYLYSRWQTEFNSWSSEMQADFIDWFNHMKGQLDEDAAGHLQNEIDNLNIILEATLEAGETSITFESNSITDESFLDLYALDSNLGYNEVMIGTGSVTYTFDEQEEDVDFCLRVANMPS